MSYLDEPLVDPTQDFDTQQQVLDQQAARIKALRDRYAKPYTPDNTEVGGFTLSTGQRIPGRIVNSPLGTLMGAAAPLLADYTAGQREQSMNQQSAALNQREQAGAMDWGKTAPQATTSQVPLGPDQPTGSFEGDPATIIKAINGIGDPTERARALQAYHNQQSGNMQTVTTQPTRDAVLQHALQGYKNPLVRATAQQYLADQLIKEPEREEARQERAAKAAADRAEAQRKQAEDLAYKRWQQQQSDETKRLIAEGNQDARRDAASASKSANEGTWVPVSPTEATGANGELLERNNKTRDVRPMNLPEGAIKPTKEPKPLSDAQQKAQDSLLTDSRTYGSAFEKYKPDYAGRGGAGKMDVLAGQYLPFYDDETKRFWEPVKARIAEQNHNTYGANFTGIEQQRANAYQPGEGNSDESNLKNLGQRAIDSAQAQLRSKYLHKYAGSYMDNDGAIVLPDGRVIKETASREISDAELKSQKLLPTPTFRDLDAGAAKPKVIGQSAQAAAPAGGPGAAGYKPPAPGTVNTAPLEEEFRRTKDPAVAQRLMSAGVPVVGSQAEYAALPAGTRYLDANGVAGTKPKK